MLLDGNFSPSASLEANGVKIDKLINIEKGDVGRGKLVKKDPLVIRMLSGIREAVNPEKVAVQEGRALKAKIESYIEACTRVHDVFGYDWNQAQLLVVGYAATAEQAENVRLVLEDADKQVGDKERRAIPPQVRDTIVDGCKNAYDEEIRMLWSKLVSSVSTGSQSFSKRTMSIITDMSPADARDFRTLSSLCIQTLVDDVLFNDPLIIKVEDGINNPLSQRILISMESYGLVDSSRNCNTLAAINKRHVQFLAGSEMWILKSEDDEKRFKTSPILTKFVIYLMSLCEEDIGKHPLLADYFLSEATRQGFDSERVS